MNDYKYIIIMSFQLFGTNTKCEIEQTANKYITIEDIGTPYEHFFLYMPQYDITHALITSDFSFIEILQDMDLFFKRNGKETTYAKDYHKKYCILCK